MLVDLISLVASGREVGVISQGKTDEELEKRLGALLLAGDHVIGIDNCEAPLGGEFLCSMLTQPSVRTRILGASKAPELPTNAFVTATGNNLVILPL
jgi:putative DNA primase/helicase